MALQGLMKNSTTFPNSLSTLFAVGILLYQPVILIAFKLCCARTLYSVHSCQVINNAVIFGTIEIRWVIKVRKIAGFRRSSPKLVILKTAPATVNKKLYRHVGHSCHHIALVFENN